MGPSPLIPVPDTMSTIRVISKRFFFIFLVASSLCIIPFVDVQPIFASADDTAGEHIITRNTGLDLPQSPVEDVVINTIAEDKVPGFDEKTARYVLLAWSDMGMKSYTDSSDSWMILPPGVNLNAQLIKRGKKPEVLVDGVVIAYAVDQEFVNPAQHVDFWKNSKALYNRDIPPNTGMTGNEVNGRMESEKDWFTVDMVPVVPYTTDGKYMPYPAFTVTATNEKGEELASTRLIAPVATEMGCQACHSGQWRKDDRAGLTAETAEHVLATHDRISGTSLQALAENDKPVLCNSCHADSSQNAQGNKEQLNLSAAIHGFHAGFLAGRGALYCVRCHPADSGGATRAFRDIHRELGMNCTYCHGEIEDLAISLLKGELAAGKQRAKVLLDKIKPANFSSADDIAARKPWVNEPDCLNCHVNFQKPEVDTSFNKWTSSEADLYRNRTDETGRLRCAACHGSPHALYPARNPYSVTRDVLQPLQYQGEPFPIGSNGNCKVCHVSDMKEEKHHPNMLREFRNQ